MPNLYKDNSKGLIILAQEFESFDYDGKIGLA